MNISPADLFSALSHETRLRCLVLLSGHEELCVCELTGALDALQPHMSRHLGTLRELGLVTDRRQGQWIYYRINPQLPAWVMAVLRTTYEAVGQLSPYAGDLAALNGGAEKRVGRCCV